MISLSKLWRRDKGICWICGGRVNRNNPPNSKLAATRDHVIPRFLGGPSSAYNIRLAHKRCNMRLGRAQSEAWKKATRDGRRATLTLGADSWDQLTGFNVKEPNDADA